MSEGGRLIICATPIGNLGDISDRLRDALKEADVVYAEDTRRTATLLRHVGATPRTRSLFVGNEARRSRDLLDDLEEGLTVALVTDAGMPAVSDPGAVAVRKSRDAGFPVTVIPGPSAVTSALALAGFGGDRFAFEGFLPRGGKERVERLTGLAGEDRPVVIFASPHRLLDDLASIAEVTGGQRPIAITRELTKLHEEVWSGPIGEAIAEWSRREVRGEITIVVAPGRGEAVSLQAALEEAKALIAEGSSLSDAARRAADSTGMSRRAIYQAMIEDQDRS